MAIPIPIDTPYGPVPIPIGIPQEAPPIHIPRVGDNYTWDDVRNFVKTSWGLVTGLVESAAGATLNDIANAVHGALDVATTAIGTYANLAFDYTNTVFITVESDISDLSDTALSQVDLMGHELDYLEGWASDVVMPALGFLEGTIAQWWDTVRGIEGAIVGGIEGWAIDHLYNPLLGDIEGVWSYLDALPLWISTEIQDAIGSLDLAGILEKLAALAGVIAAVEALTTWVNECGEPTCELVGPNSDWGKWLKLFGPLALWAMLAAVAAEDPHAIESLAEELGSTLGPVLSTWVEQWAVGGGGFPSQPGGVSGAIGSNPIVAP